MKEEFTPASLLHESAATGRMHLMVVAVIGLVILVVALYGMIAISAARACI